MTATVPTQPSGLRRVAGNAAFSAGANVAGKVTTLAWTVVAAQVLGVTDFGTLNLALTLALLCSGLAEWGFDARLMQEGSAEQGRLSRYYTEAVVWQGMVGLPLFVAAFLLVLPRYDETTAVAVGLVLLGVFVDVFSDTARAAGTAAERQGVTSVALVAQRVAMAAVAIPVLLLTGAGLLALAAVFAGTSVLGLGAHLVALRRLGIALELLRVTRSGLRSFAAGTAFLGGSALVLIVLSRVDGLILAALKGDAALGVYAATYRLYESVLFLGFALKGALFPLLRRAADTDAVRRLLTPGFGLIGLAYTPFGVLCLVEPEALLRLLYGAEYAGQGADALRWLAVVPLLYSISYLAGATLTARLQTAGLLVSALVALVVNVGLNLALIPVFGLVAAAFAMAVATAVDLVVTLLYLRKVLGGPAGVLEPLVEPVAAGLVMAAVVALSPLPVLVDAVAGGVVFLAVWYVVSRWRHPERVAQLADLVRRRRPDVTTG